MSIFPKKPISPGDMVIGVQKYGWNNHGAALLQRYFTEPVLVLEVNEHQALLYFEQSGPTWYDITKLEKVYVREEYTDRRLAKD